MANLRRIRERLGRYFRPDIYQRLLPYFLPHRLPIVVVFAITGAQSGLALLLPWTMKLLIDNGLSGQPLPAWFVRIFPFGFKVRTSIVIFAAAAGVVLKLLDYSLDVLSGSLKSRVDGGVNLRFSADLFNHLMRLSFRYHDQTTVGDSIYRITNDANFVSTMGWNNFRHILISVVQFVGIVWVLLRLDWMLALLALAVAPLQYAGITLYGKFFRAKSKHIKAMQSVTYSYIQQALSSLRVVKAFGQEARERRRVEDQSQAALEAGIRLGVQQTIYSLALSMMGRVDRAFILLIGGIHTLEGRLTVGGLVLILAYIDQLQEPLDLVGGVLQNMQASLASAERVFEVLDVQPDVRDEAGAKSLGRVRGEVAFKNVTFGYEPSQPVLHTIDLQVRAGSVAAIVGPTGAGKTTLASLIMRFYDPDHGQVALDGHDLRTISLRCLRENIALVLQEPVLLSGSIHDNIAYGRPEAGPEQIIAAAKAANAHEFIMALHDRYDTQVGERGVRLSGGERQRIAIARAFVKDSPVLILDEPTSSVDSRTEAVILDALDRLIVGRTTFVIAHRLSTIRAADQIFVLDHGRIIERGMHRELISQDGLYAEIYRIQSGALGGRRDVEVL